MNLQNWADIAPQTAPLSLHKTRGLQGVKPTSKPFGLWHVNRPKKRRAGGYMCMQVLMVLISQLLRGDSKKTRDSKVKKWGVTF